MLIRVKENRFVLVVDVVWPFFYKALVFKLLSSEGRFCHKFDAITEVVQLLASISSKANLSYGGYSFYMHIL